MGATKLRKQLVYVSVKSEPLPKKKLLGRSAGAQEPAGTGGEVHPPDPECARAQAGTPGVARGRWCRHRTIERGAAYSRHRQTERSVRATSAVAARLGSRHENGNPELQVRRGWPARAGMASSGPLPGPDAKKPAFYDDVFLTNAVVCPRARWGAGRGRERRVTCMDVPPDETEDAETEHALFECALAELLAKGVAADVRPQLPRVTVGRLLRLRLTRPTAAEIQ